MFSENKSPETISIISYIIYKAILINKKKRNIHFYNQKKNLQLPIFAYTIVGVKELNYCVRDGNRCILFAIATNLFYYFILEK